MSSIIKNIFNKKPQSDKIIPTTQPQEEKATEKAAEKTEKQFIPKSMSKVTRGPGGRFVSKNKKDLPKQEVVVKKAETIPRADKASAPQKSKVATLTMYSRPVRIAELDGKRYFVLSDIVSLCLEPYAHEELDKLRSNRESLQKINPLIKNYTLGIDGENETTECVTHEGAIAIVRMIKKPFPGPFTRWVTQVSDPSFNLPKPIDSN